MLRLIPLLMLPAAQGLARIVGRAAGVQWDQSVRYEGGRWCVLEKPLDPGGPQVLYLNDRGHFDVLMSRLRIQRLGPVVVVEERWHDGGGGVTAFFRADHELTPGEHRDTFVRMYEIENQAGKFIHEDGDEPPDDAPGGEP